MSTNYSVTIQNTIFGTFYRPDTTEKTPLVIMCHGYNGSADDWVHEGRIFAENGIAAYAFDFCGGSSRSRSKGNTYDMTIFSEKRDLLNVYAFFSEMEGIDSNNIFLFGGSQGGLVSALAADELGDKVAGLAMYFPALCIPDNWRNTYTKLSMIPDRNTFWDMTLGYEFFASIHDFYVFDNIGKFPRNVLIIHGDADPIVPLEYSHKAVETYQSAELLVIEKAGHGFEPEDAKYACEQVLGFLRDNIR